MSCHKAIVVIRTILYSNMNYERYIANPGIAKIMFGEKDKNMLQYLHFFTGQHVVTVLQIGPEQMWIL